MRDDCNELRGDDDLRYFKVKGRKWRRTDPSIPEDLGKKLVNDLMNARRQVKAGLAANDEAILLEARECVNDSKVELGERGLPWWEKPEAKDKEHRARAATKALLENTRQDGSICPSEVARVIGADSWREDMDLVRNVALSLAQEGSVVIKQKGLVVTEFGKGPSRIAHSEK